MPQPFPLFPLVPFYPRDRTAFPLSSPLVTPFDEPKELPSPVWPWSSFTSRDGYGTEPCIDEPWKNLTETFIECSDDSDVDEEELKEEDDLPIVEPQPPEETSFDDFDDEFDDDFEEDANDPDWDHPEDKDSGTLPPSKAPSKKSLALAEKAAALKAKEVAPTEVGKLTKVQKSLPEKLKKPLVVVPMKVIPKAAVVKKVKKLKKLKEKVSKKIPKSAKKKLAQKKAKKTVRKAAVKKLSKKKLLAKKRIFSKASKKKKSKKR